MRKTTIRLSDRLWDLVQAAAEEEKITAAQYMREALIARVFYDQGLRGEPFGNAPPPSEKRQAATQPRKPPSRTKKT